MLQQHDGLAILDRAIGNARQSFGQRHLDHLDVFALPLQAAAAADAVAGLVLGHEQVQLFRHRAWAHVRLEHLAGLAHAVAGFFLGLAADAGFGVVAVEQARAGLDQQTVSAAVEKGGQPELAREHHGAAARVEQQQRGAVAPVISLAAHRLPLAVAPAQRAGDLAQHVPVIGEHLHLQQLHMLGAGVQLGDGDIGHGAAHARLSSGWLGWQLTAGTNAEGVRSGGLCMFLTKLMYVISCTNMQPRAITFSNPSC